jgi:hypothetical protein
MREREREFKSSTIQILYHKHTPAPIRKRNIEVEEIENAPSFEQFRIPST